MAKVIVLVDQDGPLADYRGAIRRILTSMGEDSSRLVVQSASTYEDLVIEYGQKIADKVDAERNKRGFYEGLEVVDGAVEGIEALLDLGVVPVVCTKPRRENPTCTDEKISWLDRNFPQFDGRYILTSDKTLVVGRVLIDDKINISGLVRPLWTHLYFGKVEDVEDLGIRAIQSWGEINTISDLI